MVKEHDKLIGKVVNFIDLFMHVIFRNWLFGMVKRDDYDWKYERRLVMETVKDAKSRELRNVIIMR